MAARGARLSLIARGTDRLEAVAAELTRAGADVRVAAVDVCDRAALVSVIDGFVAEAGPCDVLLTSAGQSRPGRFLELDLEVYRRLMEVDYFGTLHAVRAVAGPMAARRRGSIVAISSAAGLFGIYGYTAYAPAKFAVRGLMEALRFEFAPLGVHVGCVFPGDVDTPQLTEDLKFQPAETTAISATVKVTSPDVVARAIVRGIERERFAIYSDRTTAALAGLAPAVAPALRAYFDRVLRQAANGPNSRT